LFDKGFVARLWLLTIVLLYRDY